MPPKRSGEGGKSIDKKKGPEIPGDASNIFSGFIFGFDNKTMHMLIKKSVELWGKRGILTYNEYVGDQKKKKVQNVGELDVATDEQRKHIDAISQRIADVIEVVQKKGKVTKAERERILNEAKAGMDYISGTSRQKN